MAPPSPSTSTGAARRAIPQRTTAWAARLADLMAAARLTPNGISLASVGCAALGAAALVLSGVAVQHGHDGARAGWLLLAAVCMPLRLLLNMLDGMLAVEKGMHSPTGELYNEVPNRFSDLLLIAAAGYATAGVWQAGAVDIGVLLGWLGTSLAVLTAYVRALGAAGGVGNFFQGPLAKPRRMWLLVAACLLSLAEPLGQARGWILAVALVLIVLGSAATVGIRLWLIGRALRARAGTADPDAADRDAADPDAADRDAEEGRPWNGTR
ncbi:CDP-alcohol phosphatidyltransferase family protein [Rothia kristinae]|uniref:CDP-alcohol phosphatidyltransferase family protein n=1 Tax=Rothia kristinae TaxID=37923 RepID=A0A7T4T3F6_9MICC|nr:CDP-alcohol phosphatidyltransferase family protein [Rothia kristinae]QQC58532.1 CDP-alcohol phosphatidyltransferase family protein [Rothia kristinae]